MSLTLVKPGESRRRKASGRRKTFEVSYVLASLPDRHVLAGPGGRYAVVGEPMTYEVVPDGKGYAVIGRRTRAGKPGIAPGDSRFTMLADIEFARAREEDILDILANRVYVRMQTSPDGAALREAQDHIRRASGALKRFNDRERRAGRLP
jgi:hypothetical protein